MDIYVFVNEGTIYTCEQQYCQAVLSEAEWNALDRSQQYAIVDGKVVLASSLVEEPETPVLPPIPLEAMFAQANVGDAQRIDALWDLALLQERTKLDSIALQRQAITAEWNQLQAEYEASL